ncbi:MAG TPA: AlkA N-terminal domain-containing protein [Thermoanaerobaculia bacterium]|nr:AlkA N-terminal domain-containing protein [Thermoanaerobaculia bacterium]
MSRSVPLTLELPPGFDLEWVFGFLAARVVPSLESLEDGVYRRSLRLEDGPLVLTAERLHHPGAGALRVRSDPPRPRPRVREIVTRMLDLDADLAAFHALAAADPILRDLVPRCPGLRLPQYLDSFEGTMRAILGQQVSLAAASTMTDRLVRRFGEVLPASEGGAGLFTFPRPEVLAAAGPASLAAIGLTRAKSSALHNLAVAVADGTIDWEHLRHAPAAEAEAALCALPGIGPWTASYVRMRTLGDRDAFPAADLGVLKAMERLGPGGPGGKRPAPREVLARAESWRPWRAYATLHLWTSLS